jgi:uncharacterized membrane protein
MKKLESSITINRNLEEVFTTVADFNSHAAWRTGLIAASLTSEGPVQAGSTYKYNMKVMGKEIETTGQIEAYQPPAHYGWKATSGPFPMSGDVKCEPTSGGGTRVTETVEVDPGGFFKLAEPLLVKQQQSQMQKDLQQLKALLEN